MFDVDSKDPSLGISCPPKAFVESNMLVAVRKLLAPNGEYLITSFILVFNSFVHTWWGHDPINLITALEFYASWGDGSGPD